MTMHEPINYLDSILNEEETKPSSYNHSWRNFSISRSGRFKSKNRKRNVVDGRFFDEQQKGATAVGGVSGAAAAAVKEQEKNSYRYPTMNSKTYSSPTSPIATAIAANVTAHSTTSARDKPVDSYKSFYETNL